MSEQSPGHSTDPNQLAQAARLRQYEVLKWNPSIAEIDLQQNGAVEADLDAITPIQVEGDSALLVSAQLGPEKVVQLWGVYDENGKLRRNILFASDEKKDNEDHVSQEARIMTLLPIVPENGPVNIGRHNNLARRRLELPESVSSNHLTIELTEKGKLRLTDTGSTFGTRILVNQTRQAETAEESQTAAQEVARDARLAALFAPRLTVSERPDKSAHDAKYRESLDRLVRGEPEPKESYQEKMAREKEAAKYIQPPSEQRQREAFSRLVRAENEDENIKAIIKKHVPSGGPVDAIALVETIRTDADLRYDLGSYLLTEKLPKISREFPHEFPYRIAVNSEKSPNHAGYSHLGRLSSREYAAMLALAMLDGTYKEPGHGDNIERNAEGRVELGQHRYAAEVLLQAYPQSYHQ